MRPFRRGAPFSAIGVVCPAATPWSIMSAMNPLTTSQRTSSAADTRAARPLRTREPRGLIEPAAASQRLAQLVGCTVTAADTSMDRLVMAVADDPVHLVVIAGTLALGSGDVAGARLAQPSSPEALQAVSAWIGRDLTAVAVEGSGALRLVCGSEQVVVAADPAHEAWEIRAMDGGLLACLPGGAISLWTPTTGQVAVGG